MSSTEDRRNLIENYSVANRSVIFVARLLDLMHPSEATDILTQQLNKFLDDMFELRKWARELSIDLPDPLIRDEYIL